VLSELIFLLLNYTKKLLFILTKIVIKTFLGCGVSGMRKQRVRTSGKTAKVVDS
jgi:hypothetical protein